MKYYVVIDTNVLVSALLTKNADSATVKILDALFDGEIIPLYHQEILSEYEEVLHRKKFHFKEKNIRLLINSIKQFGLEVFPQPTGELLPDMDDLIFYEVTMEKRKEDAYLITGNQKHYPAKHFIVTPSEFIKIINRHIY